MKNAQHLGFLMYSGISSQRNRGTRLRDHSHKEVSFIGELVGILLISALTSSPRPTFAVKVGNKTHLDANGSI